MVDPNNEIDCLVTIAINPKSFITIDGVRKVWKNHLGKDQLKFLKLMVGPKEKFLECQYELTEADNWHVHLVIHDDIEQIRQRYLKTTLAFLPKNSEKVIERIVKLDFLKTSDDVMRAIKYCRKHIVDPLNAFGMYNA